MPVWVGFAAVAAVSVVAGVLSIVTTVRHWPPTLDQQTNRRIARSLNRGRLPADAADRPAAIRLARWRASSHWGVVMMAGLALVMVLTGQNGGGLDSRLFYGVAAVAAVAAALNLAVVISGRLALRGSADAVGSR